MRFFGGKAKDGQYHVIKRWALEFGLGSGYKEVMADPEVVASFSKWRDVDISNKQLKLATSRKIAKTIWFPEWDLFMMQHVQDYIRGNGSTDQLVDAAEQPKLATSRSSISNRIPAARRPGHDEGHVCRR